MDLTLCKGELSCWNRKGCSPNCCHKVGNILESSRMSLYAVALRFPFTGTKGPSLNHENSPRPLFLLHQTFPLLQSPMAMSFTPVQPMLGIAILGLCAAAWQWKPISWHSLMNSSCADIAFSGSLELSSECCNQDRQFFTFFVLQRSHPVCLCCLPLCGWAIFALRLGQLKQGRHFINWLVPRSSVTFVYGDYIAVCSSLYTCQQWVWLK
jgi:hypothetical protein